MSIRQITPTEQTLQYELASLRKVLEQALWALQYNNNYINEKQALEAITAIQEQLK